MFPSITKYGKYKIWQTQGLDGLSLSHAGGGWEPGIYEDLEAAKRAADLCKAGKYEELQALSDRVCTITGENRLITIKDLEGI